MTREEKLTYLILKGWRVYDWLEPTETVRDCNARKKRLKDKAFILANNYSHIDCDDLDERLVILIPPWADLDHRWQDSYYTLENAMCEEIHEHR